MGISVENKLQHRSTKQVQELFFSRQSQKVNFPSLFFNQNPVIQVFLQKHLGIFLDIRLNFKEHIKTSI